MALHLGGMNPDLLKSIEEESRAAEDRLYCVMEKWLQRDVGVATGPVGPVFTGPLSGAPKILLN